MSVYRRKEVLSWCLYDFANSTYSAVIAAVVFPVYYAGYIVGNDAGLGDLWWGRAISLSMLTVALVSPLLGGIADFVGLRKRFMLAFTVLCLVSVSMFSVLEKGMVIEGFLLVVLANLGMEGAMVFYNSFLPGIAPREYMGRISSWGYGIGYLGSMLSLILALPLVSRGYFDLTWLMVVLMFGVFSLPAFLHLPADSRRGSVVQAATEGMRYTWRTLKGILGDRESRKFLIAYFIYADGVSTIIVFSSIFAATTLGFGHAELIGLYLMVQTSALAGAFLFARSVDRKGPKKVVLGSLVLWCAVCVMAFFVTEKLHFWLIASAAGVGLGTVQAASRAFYVQFIPSGKESEYFGVYTMAGKSSSVIGPLLFGYISSAAGSQRPAVLAVLVFFLVGLVTVRTVKAGGPNIRAGGD
jgi:UMF1 family MFS transporter